MSKGAMNLQDSFLNQVRRENSEVKVLLVNGTALRGIVKGFDNFTVILNNRNGQHLIYKHAIAQLVSQRPHNGGRQEGDESAAEQGGTEETSGAGSGESSDASPAAAAPAKGGNPKGQGPKPQRKDGFNKIDLSSVKLGEEKISS